MADTVLCLKGSQYHGVVKNRVYPVISITKNEDHTVTLKIQMTDRVAVFQVRHMNRVRQVQGFLAHKGDPTKSVRFVMNV